MPIAEIFLSGFISFLVFTSEHHAARNLGFRDRVGPPLDYLIGVITLGTVFVGLLGWWVLSGQPIEWWMTLAGFVAVTGGAGLAVGLAYGLEQVRDKWRRLEEDSRRKTAQIDALLREWEDGQQHRQPDSGQTPAGTGSVLLDRVGDGSQKPN